MVLTIEQKQEVIDFLKTGDYDELEFKKTSWTALLETQPIIVSFCDKYRLSSHWCALGLKDFKSQKTILNKVKTLNENEVIDSEWAFNQIQIEDNSSVFDSFLADVYVAMHGIMWTNVKTFKDLPTSKKARPVINFAKKYSRFKVGSYMTTRRNDSIIIESEDGSKTITVTPAVYASVLPYLNDADTDCVTL